MADTTVTADDISAVKEWLSDMRQLQSSYEQLVERYCQLKEATTSPRSAIPDGMPHGSTNPVDKIGAAVAKLEALRAKVERAAARANALYTEIDNAIDQITGTNWAVKRSVLQCRYLDSMTWEEITEMLFRQKKDYDLRYDTYLRRTFYFHGEALAALAAVRKGVQHNEQ